MTQGPLVQWWQTYSWKPLLSMAMTYPCMMVTEDCTDTLLSTELNVLSVCLSCSRIPQIPLVILILPDTGANRKMGVGRAALLTKKKLGFVHFTCDVENSVLGCPSQALGRDQCKWRARMSSFITFMVTMPLRGAQSWKNLNTEQRKLAWMQPSSNICKGITLTS